MSAFTHGFNHGFFHGMFNGMFGGFGMFNWCGWNSAPMFFTPSYSFGNFFYYQAPMPTTPSLLRYSTPNFTSIDTNNYNWQSYDYSMPDFSSSFYFGDTFVKTNKPKENEEKVEKATTETPEKIKAKHWSKMTDSELREVYGNYTRDITKTYSGTAADLNKYLEGKGVLEGKGQAFIDAQNKYGVSASILVAICMNESAKGTSNLAKNKNNVGGVRISGSTEFRTFDSVEKCIDYMGSFLKSGYIDNSGKALTKLYEINAKYCPASDITDKTGINSGWARNVDKYAGEIETRVNA